MTLTSHCLIILSLIFPLPSISAHASSCNEGLSLMKMLRRIHVWQGVSNVQNIKPHMNATTNQITKTEVTTDYRSRKGQSTRHHRYHLGNIHGILNIIGWGTILPIGMIVARYFRKFPMKCDEWYRLHAHCQSLGYILGTMGWSIGMYLGKSSKHYTLKTHRVLGIVIFTVATIQMFALCLQPKREDECHKYWKIYHHLMGYALIALSIANIFQGIDNQSHAEIWKWTYVGLLVLLAIIAIALELFRWIKYYFQQQMTFESDIYTSTQTN